MCLQKLPSILFMHAIFEISSNISSKFLSKISSKFLSASCGKENIILNLIVLKFGHFVDFNLKFFRDFSILAAVLYILRIVK